MYRPSVPAVCVPCLEMLESRLLLSAALPQLPQLHVDTTYVAPTGSVLNVDAAYGGNFQSALNAAQPGDVIELTAGATYQNTLGYRLPAKTNPDGQYIIIRSSAWSSLPAEGTRAGAAQASLMPKIVDTTGDGASSVIRADNQASYWRFIGLEVYRTASYTDGSIIDLGTLSLTSVDQQPNHIIIDRCYIHGVGTNQIRRGVSIQGPYMAVIDSTISHIQHSSEPQAILGGNGPGPYRIANNFLEASGENIMFGGFRVSVPNLVPSDIEFVHNLVSKDWAWRGGPYTVKNLFELKNAQRVLIEGNVFENTWAAAQYFAIVLTPRGEAGTNPWNTVRDITFRHNIVRHVSSGINVLGYDDTGTCQPVKRLLIENNLLYDVSSAYGASPRMIQLLSNHNTPMTDVIIRHNTMIFGTGGNQLISMDGTAPIADRIEYVNNIGSHGTYGIKGSGQGVGMTSINYFLANWTITSNAFLDGGTASQYPSGNWFYTTAAVKFTNASTGDYSLQATSPLKSAGTDGRDVGVIWPVLAFMTQGVVEGHPSVPPPGDANRDGVVDMADYSAWFNNYGKGGAQLSDGDFDRSGIVDMTDYAVWFNNYGLGAAESAQAVAAPAQAAAAAVSLEAADAASYVAPTGRAGYAATKKPSPGRGVLARVVIQGAPAELHAGCPSSTGFRPWLPKTPLTRLTDDDLLLDLFDALR